MEMEVVLVELVGNALENGVVYRRGLCDFNRNEFLLDSDFLCDVLVLARD